MTIKDGQRIEYIRNPIIEAVCQLRFPAILAIGAREPVQLQECIRETFPRYAQRLEKIPNSTMAVTNHTFLSENGLVKLCLTSHFIADTNIIYLNQLEIRKLSDFEYDCGPAFPSSENGPPVLFHPHGFNYFIIIRSAPIVKLFSLAASFFSRHSQTDSLQVQVKVI